MPANKYALLRYRIIDRCLTNQGKPFPTREDLRQACEEALFGSGSDAISLSTIDKDIWAMKNESELGYFAPIKYSKGDGGYYYEEEGYTISELSLGDDDLEAIRFAAATLDQFRDVPIFKQYESAIEKIINRVNISTNPADKTLDQFVQFEKSTVSLGNEFLGPLLDHIRSRKSIRIQYRKFQDDKVKEYELHPYLLKEYHNRWYLVAMDADHAKIRTFGLERIAHLETGDRKFTPDKSFNADLFFKYSIGITERSDKPQDIVLSFDPVPGKFLLTQPIHPSQHIISEQKNNMVIGLKVLVTPELISFILSYGAQVKVLKPSSLRQEIKKQLGEAISFYKEK
ncbi:MAG: WYL domain-containing protein [Flavobacteriales bacterium]|nr:WYL domain-containing protein [Flavobacteriales bacterium]